MTREIKSACYLVNHRGAPWRRRWNPSAAPWPPRQSTDEPAGSGRHRRGGRRGVAHGRARRPWAGAGGAGHPRGAGGRWAHAGRRRRGVPRAVVGGAGRVPGYPPSVHRVHQHRRVELRDPRRARRRGDRRRPVRGRDRGLRVDAAQRPAPRAQPRVPTAARAESDGRVGAALRHADADGALRAGGQPAHGRVRDHLGAARRDRGEHPGVGGVEPPGPLPGPHYRGGRAGVADAVVAAAPARLLPGDRRGRGLRHDHRGAGPRAAPGRRCTCSGRPPVTTTRSSARCPT